MSLQIHQDADAQTLEAATVLIEISTRRHGNTATVDASEVKVDADADMIAVRKKLLDSPQWQAVKAFDQETYRFIGKRALKGRLKAGVYRLPLALLKATEEAMQGRAKERQSLVTVFLSCLEPLQREASEKLRCVYRESDYPAFEVVKGNFAFDWRYYAQSVPERLWNVAPDAAIREMERETNEAQRELDAIRGELRAGLAGLLFKLLERLTPGEDGKGKRFEFTTIENLREFLGLFEARNLARDAELAAVVEAAGAALRGINPQTLRSDEAAREKLRRALEAMDGQMSQLLPAPTLAAIRESVAPKPSKRKMRALLD